MEYIVERECRGRDKINREEKKKEKERRRIRKKERRRRTRNSGSYTHTHTVLVSRGKYISPLLSLKQSLPLFFSFLKNQKLKLSLSVAFTTKLCSHCVSPLLLCSLSIASKPQTISNTKIVASLFPCSAPNLQSSGRLVKWRGNRGSSRR